MKTKHCNCKFLQSFSVMLIVVAGVNSQDLKSGLTALKAGKIEEARKILESVYRKNSSDSDVKFAYAQAAPCSVALQLYRELSSSETVKDSIKAGAFCRLGDYSYALKEYQKSVEFYRLAAKNSSSPEYRHKWALSSMAAGDIEAAQSLWHTLSLEYGDEISQMANYYLGTLQLKNGNYQNAHNYFIKTGKADQKHYWTIASLAGRLECASRLGLTDKVKVYSEQLKPFQNSILEKDLLELSISDYHADKEDLAGEDKEDSADTLSGIFTLQAGAFGSAENAANFQKKLSKEFKDVTVVEAKLGEQVFYRVRVGTFKSREDAQVFASDSLGKKGLSCTVVEK